MWHLLLAIITTPTTHLTGITEDITEDMDGLATVMDSACLDMVMAITRTLPEALLHP
jgi:hypothetical protein